MTENAITATIPLSLKNVDEVAALFKRIDLKNPKPEDVAALQKYLKETPDLWRVVGDLEKLAQDRIMGGMNASRLFTESVKHGVTVLKKELGEEGAPMIERLLIEQAVTCWLELNMTQFAHAGATSKSIPITEAEYWEHRLSASQRRYLRALETLARVRRLLRPNAVQVNIASQQVNVMGDVKPAAAGRQS